MRATKLVWVVALAVGLGGCTGLVTGGEDPGVGGDDDDDSNPSRPDAAPPLPGDPDAAPGSPDAGPDDPEPPLPEDNPLAAGISIREVAMFQTVAVPLARNGSAVTTRSAPVVEGHDGMIAIAFEVEGGFSARAIQARVTIDGTTYRAQKTISASSGDLPANALQVKVPGAAVKVGAAFEVSLHEIDGAPSAGTPSGARYPAQGTAPLGAVSANGPMKLVLVPFRYTADGSNRLPPTDANAVTAYRNAFRAMYPVADVEVTVRAPVDLEFVVRSESSWGQWLDRLDAVREADDPASNVYYYGIGSPATSFGTFCAGSCIVGLGHVPGASNSFLFASVGVAFANNLLIDTALHEVGHTMGRPHVGCGGPSGVDPAYPYQGGSIGVWGYDAITGELKNPGEATDIMGYCNDQWISDYQFNKIFERISRVNDAAPFVIGAPQTYRVGIVDGEGNVEWRRNVTLRLPPEGGETLVSLRDLHGVDLGTTDGHYFPYDHIPGGKIYVPVAGVLDTTALAPRAFTVIR